MRAHHLLHLLLPAATLLSSACWTTAAKRRSRQCGQMPQDVEVVFNHHGTAFFSYTGSDADLPDAVDYELDGAVTPVQDQASHYTCWAFALTGAYEGQHYLETCELEHFSEQLVIDCCSCHHTHGLAAACVKMLGLLPNWQHQYTGRPGVCLLLAAPAGATGPPTHHSCPFVAPAAAPEAASEPSAVYVETGNERALRAAVATEGPVVVTTLCSEEWNDHEQIIMSTPCSPDPELAEYRHRMLVVGYGTTEEGQDYWKIKNSWGTDLGRKGYVFLARNQNNLCGVATHAWFPLTKALEKFLLPQS